MLNRSYSIIAFSKLARIRNGAFHMNHKMRRRLGHRLVTQGGVGGTDRAHTHS